MAQIQRVSTGRLTKGQRLWRDIRRYRWVYLMALPAILYFIVFCYRPMYGATLSFKKFSFKLGILDSPWIGMKHFQRIFITPLAMNAILNTLIISAERMVFEFPIPIILAVLFNELKSTRLRKVYQTVYTFPHFLSWVTVAAIIVNIFGMYGLVNGMRVTFGLDRVNYMTDSGFIRPMLFISANWKEMGWAAIIYIAAITGIDPTLYEAAIIDGANRFQRIVYITIPSISYMIVTQLILSLGGLMNAGFDQIFYLMNPANRESVEIIDTYVHYITFQAIPDYGFSSAVGLFKTVINCILLLAANRCVKWIGGSGLLD